MDFDPEQNVAVVIDFPHRAVWAHRRKEVPPGTKARMQKVTGQFAMQPCGTRR